MNPEHQKSEISIVMPCLNEASTLESCLRKAQQAVKAHLLRAEIIVADNGSTDGSREIAERCGARLVEVPKRGYGAALMGGIAAAEGNLIVMGDADDSYDFSALAPFIDKLREGYDRSWDAAFPGKVEKSCRMPCPGRTDGSAIPSSPGSAAPSSRSP